MPRLSKNDNSYRRMCHCAQAFFKLQLQENMPLCPGLAKMTTATGECAIVPRLTATGECAIVPRLSKMPTSRISSLQFQTRISLYANNKHFRFTVSKTTSTQESHCSSPYFMSTDSKTATTQKLHCVITMHSSCLQFLMINV